MHPRSLKVLLISLFPISRIRTVRCERLTLQGWVGIGWVGGREGSGDLRVGDLGTWGPSAPSAPAAAGRPGLESFSILVCPASWEHVSSSSPALPNLSSSFYPYECARMDAEWHRDGKPSPPLRRSGPAGSSMLRRINLTGRERKSAPLCLVVRVALMFPSVVAYSCIRRRIALLLCITFCHGLVALSWVRSLAVACVHHLRQESSPSASIIQT